MEGGGQTYILVLDFSKALDEVGHRLKLIKGVVSKKKNCGAASVVDLPTNRGHSF